MYAFSHEEGSCMKSFALYETVTFKSVSTMEYSMHFKGKLRRY